MAAFQIGEVEELTGIKTHILRYWEENLPFLTPQKDLGGRRVYSSRDVQLIMRVKQLVYEKKYTLEGAKEQIFRESISNKSTKLSSNINMLKYDLIELFGIIKQQKERQQDRKR